MTRNAVTLAFAVAVLLIARPFISARPRPAPMLPAPTQLHIVPLPPRAPATVAEVVVAIGTRFQVSIVSFVPAFPVDIHKAALALSATDVDSAIAIFAGAIDGHVLDRPGGVIAIVPNFRVDAPSGPLVPKVRDVVRVSNGLVTAFDTLSPSERARALEPDGAPFAILSPATIAAIEGLTIDSHSFDFALFDGHHTSDRSLGFKPEMLVSVRYGGVRIGWFDAWEQQNNSDIVWETDRSLDTARAAWKPDESNLAAPVTWPNATLSVTGGRMTVADAASAMRDAGATVFVDSPAAPLAVAVSRGRYQAANLIEAIRQCLRLRVLNVAVPGASSAYLLATASPADDEKLVHDAVDRQIAATWQPLIDTLKVTGNPAVFGWDRFASFATVPYPELGDDERAAVDKLFLRLPTPLADDERGRITVTFRSALLAEGKLGGSSSGLTEQIGAVFGDTAP